MFNIPPNIHLITSVTPSCKYFGTKKKSNWGKPSFWTNSAWTAHIYQIIGIWEWPFLIKHGNNPFKGRCVPSFFCHKKCKGSSEDIKIKRYYKIFCELLTIWERLSSLEIPLQGQHVADVVISLETGGIFHCHPCAFALCSSASMCTEGCRLSPTWPWAITSRPQCGLLSDSAQVHTAACQSWSLSHTLAINTLQPPDKVC